MADEQFTSLDNMDITKLKVSDLKRELKARGLNSSGNKMELAQRLTESISGKNDDGSGSADSVDDLIDEDDVLNDDEIEEEVDNMKHIELEVSDRSFENDSSPVKPLKRKIEVANNNTANEVKTTKKIILNRLSTDVLSENYVPPTNSTNGSGEEKKVVKLSELTPQERLEMRAKKFGTPITSDAKKVARAQRFSESDTKDTKPATSSTKTPITFGSAAATTGTTSHLDRLKSKSDRVGAVAIPTSKTTSKEKLELRKARFASTTNGTNSSTTSSITSSTISGTTPSTTSGATSDEKKAKRLERFKTNS